MTKYETSGETNEKFVCLRSKLFAYKIFEEEEEKQWKGMKKNVVKIVLGLKIMQCVCLQRKSKWGQWILLGHSRGGHERANFPVAIAVALLFSDKNHEYGSKLSPFYRYQ